MTVAPFVPLVLAPAIPSTPLASSLGSAARAIGAARGVDPAAAARAAAFYVRAQQQAASGDVSGALASSALARAAALAPTFGGGLAPAVPFDAGVGRPPAYAPIPLAAGANALSSDLLATRNAIGRAEGRRDDATLARAKAAYRRALDAYLDGDLARSERESRAARELVK